MECKVTVVTPSYNQAPFLDETIRSVLAQRRAIHEFFVLDGGSTDGSPDIIRKYAPSIDWWESRKDGGQADAIHKGMSRATGDILYWINSDDVLLPGAVDAVRAMFHSCSDVDVVSGWDVVIDEASRVVRARHPGLQTQRAARWGVTHVSQPTCFFRRSLYEATGGLDQALGGILDTELWYRMLDRSPRWGHVPRYLAAFRVHSQSKGRTWGDRFEQERRSILERHPEYTNRPVRHAVGRFIYRSARLVTGSYLRVALETRRLHGLSVDDVTLA